MDMTVKFKLMLIWIFVVVVIGFAAHHFLNGAFSMIQNVVAMNVVLAPTVAKWGALICGTHF
jgi:hypothetical protein